MSNPNIFIQPTYENIKKFYKIYIHTYTFTSRQTLILRVPKYQLALERLCEHRNIRCFYWNFLASSMQVSAIRAEIRYGSAFDAGRRSSM